ncbi:polysaccharide pyruvyl transferase family protein [Actinacidiphila guanduensis]|uniref:Polysaccharide pyruvyl transferase family protein WcaK n=1 Tax=Actinacidiphila guanduensis TaxID=310781 RepID=A0A1H0FKQ0_9ACTN|nr:polysaccharide pyruvyl transferase family protein [Actinacidiphila guanduensis]SDN95122.1 Polysaccharide pyruvyl transferase family protein WcaK [Actinacidiphila guanduensis]
MNPGTSFSTGTDAGPAGTTDPAARGGVTGKRLIAFTSCVTADRLPAFLGLLRSLALTNPGVCEDYVVLHDGSLPADAADRIHAVHPRARLRAIDTERLGGWAALATAGSNTAGSGTADPFAYALLEAFRIREFGTLVVLDPELTARGGIEPLLRLRDGLAAAPLDGEGPDGQRRLDARVLVVQAEYLTDGFCARLEAVARSGAHDRARGAAGVLEAALGGDFVPLQGPADGGPFAPAAAGTDPADEPSEAEFHAAFLALSAAAHHDLLVHYGTAHVARTRDLQTARRVATARIDAGEYQEAVDLLRSVDIPLDEAWPHEVYGHALMSISRYEEARAHLLLSTAVPNRAATAFARLAHIAWVTNDDEAAAAYARAGLSADPSHGPSRQMVERATLDLPGTAGGVVVKEGPAHKQFAHVAFYMPRQGNAGDKLLPESVRLAFDREIGPRRWHSVHAHRLFDEAALERVNARRAVVIGGGGLFIPDTAPNGNSAWQWNVTDEVLERIDVPVVVYAVGFNAFDGQSYRQERFATAVRKLVEKSAFFGLRNHGSIAQVRRLLPRGLHGKVRFQPCPTTVTRQLVAGWKDAPEREDTVLLNAAYDRAGLRFGHDYGHFLDQLARAVRAIGRHAEVRCAAHALDDERIAFDLRREHGISLPVIPMYDHDCDTIRAAYARTKLVIGMRGHAGMIPFGCGTPIISLISHPKMAYFLADIDRPEWGVSVHDRDLAAVLTEKALAVLTDHRAAVADVLGRQEELWRITRANAEEITALL